MHWHFTLTVHERGWLCVRSHLPVCVCLSCSRFNFLKPWPVETSLLLCVGPTSCARSRGHATRWALRASDVHAFWRKKKGRKEWRFSAARWEVIRIHKPLTVYTKWCSGYIFTQCYVSNSKTYLLHNRNHEKQPAQFNETWSSAGLKMPLHSNVWRFILTNKVGQTDLVFAMWSEFISRSVHAK